jgi:phosphatidate cytidylyltransferase
MLIFPMKRVITAGVVVPIVMMLIFRAPYPLFVVAVAAVALIASWEFLAIADRSGAATPRIAVVVSTAMLFAISYDRPDMIAPFLSLTSLTLLVICALSSPIDRVLPDTACCIFGLIYVGYSLTTLPWLLARENGPSLVLYLLFVVWSGDIAALYVGRSLGRHKLAPTLSPNKTWEGSAGSVAGSLLVAAGLYFLAQALGGRDILLLSYPGPLLHWLLLALLLNAAAQLGDLAESALKRGAGVKDSGSILPGHGGMLDRIDALLLAAPVLWYAQLIQQL